MMSDDDAERLGFLTRGTCVVVLSGVGTRWPRVWFGDDIYIQLLFSESGGVS